MKNSFTLLGFCFLMALFSCTTPSGVDVTQHFNVSSSYYRLEISDGMIVTVTDDVDDIVITADENVMEKIIVKFSGYGTLQIYRKDFSMMYLNTAKVMLPFNPGLKTVSVKSNSEFHTPYGIDCNKADILVENYSKFYGYINADELELKIRDHSEAHVSFDVYNNAYVEIKESSNLHVEEYTYAPTVNLVMKDNSVLERKWYGEFLAFMCQTCYGSMDGNCKAHIDSETCIAMKLTNNCRLYYTSNPDIDGSLIDGTSEFIYDGY